MAVSLALSRWILYPEHPGFGECHLSKRVASGDRAPSGEHSGVDRSYKTIDYDTLVDSPIFAGKYFKAVELSPKVTLNIVADEARYLNFTAEQIAAHKKLVSQSRTLFGTEHFDHYDFLLALSNEQIGRATSELQSLMRISYPVFCLHKK